MEMEIETRLLCKREILENSDRLYDLLSEADMDFCPPLSKRSSTTDTAFSGGSGEGSIRPYLLRMMEQKMLAAFSGTELIGFVSFIENYSSDAIDATMPNIYVSTLIVARSARGRGLTKKMYSALFTKEFPNCAVYTRTWSTNAAHQKILSSFGFLEIRRIKDDRGQGIDTVYYFKRAEAAPC